MSLITDRARAIIAAVESDGEARRVFLMPRPAFACRIVAVPDSWDEVMAWVRAEAEEEVGGFAEGAEVSDVVGALKECMGWPGVPQGTAARVSH
jgi:hypothetical protein